MTVAQEGIGSTKIQIYTVLPPKFGVSETKFWPSPPVLQSSDQVPSFIIPQNKPASVLVHPLKGHQDWTTLSRFKGGVKKYTSPETPCSILTLQYPLKPFYFTQCLLKVDVSRRFWFAPHRQSSYSGIKEGERHVS